MINKTDFSEMSMAMFLTLLVNISGIVVVMKQFYFSYKQVQQVKHDYLLHMQ